jgi:CRP/FNR family nitrogen fixation transcriptional regulator
LNDGRRQIDEFHLGGDIFGLETGDEHRFSADAVDAATIVAFRRRRFETLAHDDPALGDQVMSSMMRSLERAHDHMMLLGRKTAQEKVATFLLNMARRVSKEDSFELPMQRTDIADHLGLTIETVSRTMTQFAREGLIKLAAARRSVVLCDKAALRRLNA